MNLILEKSSYAKYYSYLDAIFHHLPELHEYHWLITDLKLNNYPDDKLKSESIVMTGKELSAYLKRYRIQFIWGVFSAFKAPIFAIPKELPFADGNKNFWHRSPRPQAPGAEFEIVCWDSTCTLFIGFPKNLAKRIWQLFPDIQNLDEENEQRANN